MRARDLGEALNSGSKDTASGAKGRTSAIEVSGLLSYGSVLAIEERISASKRRAFPNELSALLSKGSAMATEGRA